MNYTTTWTFTATDNITEPVRRAQERVEQATEKVRKFGDCLRAVRAIDWQAASQGQDYTGIVVGSDIIYENGAKVKTSFVSNLFGDVKILGDSYLYERLKQTQGENKKCLPRYIYPDNLITVADVTKIVAQGGSITINKKEVAHCRALESQKPFKKTIFGSGFIMSDEATERMKTERIKAKKEIITWTLSDREKELVKTLG